jgi:hypothetical protein
MDENSRQVTNIIGQVTKKCAFCGGVFKPKRSTAKYCCEGHRIKDFLNKKKGVKINKPPLIVSDNEKIGNEVVSFCNQHNCTWADVKGGYLASLNPIAAKAKIGKIAVAVQDKPKSSGGGYNRRETKLGF